MSISKTLLNQYRKQNQDSKYSTESLNDLSNLEVSEECAVALINIQKDNSYSYEHWNNKVLNTYNEAVLMSHLSLEPIRDRNRKKKMIKDMRNRSFSIEQCNQVIEIMSMEGIKEFGQRMWDLAIKGWEKLLELLAQLKRWIGRVIRAPFTKPQVDLYNQYKDKIASVVAKVPANTTRKLLPYTVNNSDNLKPNQIKQMINDLKSGLKDFDFTGDPDKKDFVVTINKDITLSNTEAGDSPQELVNKYFFGTKKVPSKKEVDIREILLSNRFSILSKEVLDDLDKINQVADGLMRVVGKKIKEGKEKIKKDVDLKNMSQEEKEKYKKDLKLNAKQRNGALAYVSFLRAFVNACFSYRSTVYKAAKAAIAIAENKSEDGKK